MNKKSIFEQYALVATNRTLRILYAKGGNETVRSLQTQSMHYQKYRATGVLDGDCAAYMDLIGAAMESGYTAMVEWRGTGFDGLDPVAAYIAAACKAVRSRVYAERAQKHRRPVVVYDEIPAAPYDVIHADGTRETVQPLGKDGKPLTLKVNSRTAYKMEIISLDHALETQPQSILNIAHYDGIENLERAGIDELAERMKKVLRPSQQKAVSALAKHGTQTAAASALGVSQQAVSKTIAGARAALVAVPYIRRTYRSARQWSAKQA